MGTRRREPPDGAPFPVAVIGVPACTAGTDFLVLVKKAFIFGLQISSGVRGQTAPGVAITRRTGAGARAR